MFARMKKVIKTIFFKGDNSNYELALRKMQSMDMIMCHLEERNCDFIKRTKKEVEEILKDNKYLKLVNK